MHDHIDYKLDYFDNNQNTAFEANNQEGFLYYSVLACWCESDIWNVYKFLELSS